MEAREHPVRDPISPRGDFVCSLVDSSACCGIASHGRRRAPAVREAIRFLFVAIGKQACRGNALHSVDVRMRKAAIPHIRGIGDLVASAKQFLRSEGVARARLVRASGRPLEFLEHAACRSDVSFRRAPVEPSPIDEDRRFTRRRRQAARRAGRGRRLACRTPTSTPDVRASWGSSSACGTSSPCGGRP